MTARLHHRLDGPGDAPVLVLSGSLGTTQAMWDAQAPVLTQHFRLLRYDQRGHGASETPPGPYEIADLGRDVLALLDQLGLERVSFCGMSIGGMTGMWLGINAPERIDRLVLSCTAAHFPPREQWDERAGIARSNGVAALADAALERWFTPGFTRDRPDEIERFRGMLGATPGEGYAGCCEAIRDMDLRAGLGRIRAPTLVIAGDDDPSTPPERGQEIADTVPGARLIVLEDARHIANVAQPEAYTGAVLAHLEGGTT
ncbi:MAG TPA: 3-oxoadipate enol-lactonase [Thermoleophilaceae bacterium]|nr:3-oxoadipate enol-lactonase [Thermoleophilaceae bacterium]